MREITTHIVEGDSANHQLKIEVVDEPGSGGASHAYNIAGFNTETNPSVKGNQYYGELIVFQNGTIKENGVNGVTQEALLAIVIDRLESFQKGPFACSDNEEALEWARKCLSVLQRRTRARIARGVEGTHAA